MSVIQELIRTEQDGTLSFGNYELGEKSKVSDFEYQGDLYKVKTFHEITKLERNGMFIYESVPGTAVHNFKVSDRVVSFCVEGSEDAQITLELEAEKEYKVFINHVNVGKMKTNLGGKLPLSVELSKDECVEVKVERL
ncbi:MAG: endosialidase [Firmicutes bacterium]|uniref:Endosialidase n=1 Tax=Candidatus Scybalomonas excrementavium TaxID=2840943 RepID=A0A9D9I1G5_9FIRM|nr:endosialidase [Candidatus Scybalomonas excrementavium]